MLGMDWVGPITPAGSVTGVVYILLMVDYSTRSIWAKNKLKHTADEAIDVYKNHVSSIFGHSKCSVFGQWLPLCQSERTRLFSRKRCNAFY